jgi:predicted ATPase
LAAPFRSVITGGPGAGKSTLLSALSGEGIQTFPEVARAILKDEGGMELRAARPAEFALAMLRAELDAWDSARPGPVLYDRGFPDIVGFLELEGLPIPAELDQVCRAHRYAGPIFRAPPWREIYTPDEERIQDWGQAIASDAAISSAWKRYGYDLVDLPFASVTDRVKFVLQGLHADRPKELPE